MKIVFKHRILQQPLVNYKNEMNDENTLKIIIVSERFLYILYENHKDKQDLCPDILFEEKTNIKEIKNCQYITRKGNVITYIMDTDTLSELKKYILKTTCNIIEIVDWDTSYDKSSKYSYFVDLCESLNKFKKLVYIIQ